MATLFAHSFVGFTLAKVLPKQNFCSIGERKKFYWAMTILPVIPDLDYIGYAFHVPYDSFWGHRGFTHSLLACALVALSVHFIFDFNVKEPKAKSFPSLLNGRFWVRFWGRFFVRFDVWRRAIVSFYLFSAIFMHPFLDAMTNGGLGVAFYSPYSLTRHFFSWRPIQVSPMGVHFFSERGLVVLISEFFWIFAPCLLVLAIQFSVSQYLQKKKIL